MMRFQIVVLKCHWNENKIHTAHTGMKCIPFQFYKNTMWIKKIEIKFPMRRSFPFCDPTNWTTRILGIDDQSYSRISSSPNYLQFFLQYLINCSYLMNWPTYEQIMKYFIHESWRTSSFQKNSLFENNYVEN